MKQDRSPLAEAIREAWSAAQSNEEATERLLAIMRQDPAVYSLAMAPHEHNVAASLVSRQKIERRHYIWTRPAAPDNRVSALSRVNAVSLLDMRLPSGKRLGDATRDEVEDAAQDYTARAKFNSDKAGFFTAVARKMKPKQTVAAAWTAAELEEIRNA